MAFISYTDALHSARAEAAALMGHLETDENIDPKPALRSARVRLRCIIKFLRRCRGTIDADQGNVSRAMRWLNHDCFSPANLRHLLCDENSICRRNGSTRICASMEMLRDLLSFYNSMITLVYFHRLYTEERPPVHRNIRVILRRVRRQIAAPAS